MEKYSQFRDKGTICYTIRHPPLRLGAKADAKRCRHRNRALPPRPACAREFSMDACVRHAFPLPAAVPAGYIVHILCLLGVDTSWWRGSGSCGQVLRALVDVGDSRGLVGGFAG